jgi:tRNA threonylcarbamoyladenosine biosynthesis protein TsaB
MRDDQSSESWLLAIDTSTERAGLAVTNGIDVSELSWTAGRDQTVSVLAQIDHLLALTGIESSALAAIGVASGPGMFNGLRVGMSLAKGFHFGLGAALIGVSTLEIGVRPFRALGFPIVSVVAAGRGRLVWQFSDERGVVSGNLVNGTIEELNDALARSSGRVIVAGDLTSEQAATLDENDLAIVPSASSRLRRPSVLAEIAWERYRLGEIDDPIALAPVYLHASPVAGRG